MNRYWLSIFAGIALGEVMAYAVRSVLTQAAIIIPIVGFLIFIFISLKRKGKQCQVIVLFGIAFLIGIIRMDLVTGKYDRIITGYKEVTDCNSTTEHLIDDMQIKNGRLVCHCDTLLVYCDISEADRLKIGNRILINGKITECSGPRNPGEFNYKLYYMSQGITHRCFADSITIIDEHTDVIKQKIYDIRAILSSHIGSCNNEEDAGILKAALIGDKDSLDDDLYDLYRKNGIAHLLAISGLHIGILGMGIYRLLRKLRLSYSSCGLISGIIIIIYTVLTGSSVSTVRACIMLLISFLAAAAGRKYNLANAAFASGSIIALFNPYEIFTCGFLLSFGAVIAIGLPAQAVSKNIGLHRLKGIKRTLADSFISSLAVQFVTLPIMSYFFFEVSLLSVLLNLIVIPLMTYVVWSGILSAALSFICTPLSVLTAGSAHYILLFYRKLCELTSKVPFNTILIGRPSIWQIVLYYLCFSVVLFLFRSSHKKQS